MSGFDGRKRSAEHVADPASRCVKPVATNGLGATDADNFTDGLARGFVSSIAVDVDFIDASGQAIVGFPAAQGYNPVKVVRFTNLAGSNIWGLF